MAKSYLSVQEACDALNMSETQIKDLVRKGKLREFRDGGKINYKADDVQKLAAASGIRPAEDTSSGSGELVLEPADDTGIDLASTGSETGLDLASSGSDVISLAETDSDATAVGGETDKEKKKKDDTVITSVGVSVFEDDEADVSSDPVAETVVSDGGLGIEGVGSGSGLLDLTRESDDTSLGAELLDEMLPSDDSAEMGEATRAGLDEMVTEAPSEAPEPVAAEAPVARGAVVTQYEYPPDPLSTGLTGLMGVAVLIMCLIGLTVAAMLHNAVPGLLAVLYENLLIFGGAAVVVAGIATGVGFVLGKKAEQG